MGSGTIERMTKGPPANALAYSLKDAAALCGVSTELLRQAIKSGDLPAKRTFKSPPGEPPKGRTLILRRDLEAFLEGLPDDWWGSRY